MGKGGVGSLRGAEKVLALPEQQSLRPICSRAGADPGQVGAGPQPVRHLPGSESLFSSRGPETAGLQQGGGVDRLMGWVMSRDEDPLRDGRKGRGSG